MPNTTAPNAKWLQSAVLAHLSPEKKERATRQWAGSLLKGPAWWTQQKGSRPKSQSKPPLSGWAPWGLSRVRTELGGGQGFTVPYWPAYRQFLWPHTWGEIQCAHPDFPACQAERWREKGVGLILKAEWGYVTEAGTSEVTVCKRYSFAI